MASPIYDALSVQHSKNIGDPASSASTDGKIWSSVQRDNHFNVAIKRWMLRQAQDGNLNALRGYIGTDSQSLSSNVVARTTYSGSVFYIISAYNATNSVFIDRIDENLRLDIVNSRIPFLAPTTYQEYWSYEGLNIRIYGAGATDSITLHYVKEHTDLSAGASADIVIPKTHHGEILDLAYKVAQEENADPEFMQIAMAKDGAIERGTALKNA